MSAMKRNPRILLVEDDVAQARLFERWLTAGGYDVTHAASAITALNQRHTRWDIVVSDIDLPDGSGLDLAASFKQAAPGLPVLLLTSHGKVDLALQALRAKVDDMLLKQTPLSADALCERVAALLAARTAEAVRVLAIGAHPDDVEIGCGGALLRHAEQGHPITILTLTPGAAGGDPERRALECEAAAAHLGARLVIGNCADRTIGEGAETIGLIERVMAACGPTTIYTHTEHDTHQDHRAVARATLVAGRGVRNILCYQSPSTTIDFRPTTFVDVTRHVERKLELIASHASQASHRPYLERDLVIATTRYWGRFGGTRHAEPFQAIRAAV